MKRLVLTATALLFAFAAAPMARADEIDDAVAMFTADDGLTAAEKLPALKALVEVHKDNPKVEKLTAILKNLAAEAGEPVADGRDKRDPPAVEPAGVGGDTSVEATDAGGTGSVSAPKVLQSIATAGDDDYVAILDEEKDSTPDIRTEDEKSFLYTIEDAQAAADAAATEALKSGTVHLVGTNHDLIVSEVSTLLDDAASYERMSKAVNPYGDGQACSRIVRALKGEEVERYEV